MGSWHSAKTPWGWRRYRDRRLAISYPRYWQALDPPPTKGAIVSIAEGRRALIEVVGLEAETKPIPLADFVAESIINDISSPRYGNGQVRSHSTVDVSELARFHRVKTSYEEGERTFFCHYVIVGVQREVIQVGLKTHQRTKFPAMEYDGPPPKLSAGEVFSIVVGSLRTPWLAKGLSDAVLAS